MSEPAMLITHCTVIPPSTSADVGRVPETPDPLHENLARALRGDAEARASESWTWKNWKPDPWEIRSTNGQVLAQIAGIQATKIRATLTTGGYQASWTFKADFVTRGWRTKERDNPPARFRFHALNAQGGILFYHEFTRHVLCATEVHLMGAAFNPDVYEIWTGVSLTLVGQHYFWRC